MTRLFYGIVILSTDNAKLVVHGLVGGGHLPAAVGELSAIGIVPPAVAAGTGGKIARAWVEIGAGDTDHHVLAL